jgi:hypothetical protein
VETAGTFAALHEPPKGGGVITCGGKVVSATDLARTYLRAVERAPTLPARLKALLRAKGWSIRRAAVAIGCQYQHLSYVINGHRQSKRIAAAIIALGHSPQAYTCAGFARR